LADRDEVSSRVCDIRCKQKADSKSDRPQPVVDAKTTREQNSLRFLRGALRLRSAAEGWTAARRFNAFHR